MAAEPKSNLDLLERQMLRIHPREIIGPCFAGAFMAAAAVCPFLIENGSGPFFWFYIFETIAAVIGAGIGYACVDFTKGFDWSQERQQIMHWSYRAGWNADGSAKENMHEVQRHELEAMAARRLRMFDVEPLPIADLKTEAETI